MYTTNEINFLNAGISKAQSGSSKIKEMGKNDFLNLLVTQLRYQNPLEPMQDQEFVAQLAQFSQLEQLENMRQSLETSTEVSYLMAQTIANTMATTLIGKTVVAEGMNLTLVPGRDVGLSFDLADDAANVTIKILNENGAAVRTVTLQNRSKGKNTYTWNGRDDSGSSLPPGQYSFTVEATDRTGATVQVTKRTIGVVEGVTYEQGKAYLIIPGYKIDLSTIIEIVNGLSGRTGTS